MILISLLHVDKSSSKSFFFFLPFTTWLPEVIFSALLMLWTKIALWYDCFESFLFGFKNIFDPLAFFYIYIDLLS